jgi:hypothetical protein
MAEVLMSQQINPCFVGTLEGPLESTHPVCAACSLLCKIYALKMMVFSFHI